MNYIILKLFSEKLKKFTHNIYYVLVNVDAGTIFGFDFAWTQHMRSKEQMKYYRYFYICEEYKKVVEKYPNQYEDQTVQIIRCKNVKVHKPGQREKED